MIDIKFTNGNSSLKFIMDKKKYILSDDPNTYWTIMNCAKSSQEKITESDYQNKFNLSTSIQIDSELITKYDEIIIISSNFNIDEDMKLGSKSLMLKYVSSLINEKLSSDDLNRINTMLSIFADDISTNEIELSINELTTKSIIKLITANIVKDNLYINKNDINYEETIILQLYMLKKIINKTLRYIVIVDTPWLTKNIIKEIEEIDNCYVIVISHRLYSNIEGTNLYIDGIDFENEQEIYERMMNMSNEYDLNKYIHGLLEEHLIKFK